MSDPKTYVALQGVREALLALVDVIERYLDLPRTADLRKRLKEADRR